MKTMELKPTARLSVKKSVLKQYTVDGEKVYFLKDGTNFEIELFNPLSETILAKIAFNAQASNWEGIVLRPGQRVFLERHIETDKKLKFVTYEIEDTPEAQAAAKQNGLVAVYFYKELAWSLPIGSTVTITPTYINHTPYYGSGGITYTTGSSFTDINTFMNQVECSYTSGPVETGLITKGETSKQNLVDTYEQFNNFAFLKETFRILPDSLQIKNIKHKHYCSRCGNKVKHDDNFCANCGKELN